MAARAIARRGAAAIDEWPPARRPGPLAGGASWRDRPSGGVPAGIAAPLEPLLGIDLSPVRLHTDAASAALSHQLRAHAFTIGTDVYFGSGRYRPDTAAGRQLLAHELAHVSQQAAGGGPRLQRSPYGDVPGSSAEIHGTLGEGYTGDLQMPSAGAVQYTEGYRQWLRSSTASNVRWTPPTFRQNNPLDRLRAGLPTGYTDLTVNGVSINPPNTNAAAYLASLEPQLTPTAVTFSPGLVTGQVACRFDPAFKIESSTVVDELTPPPAAGWTANLPPATVGAAARCAGKATVPVTLNSNPRQRRYDEIVHDAEMEHVADIKTLHDRHFVPHYHFVTSLSATGGTNTICEGLLRQRLGDRVQQASLGFLLGDLAETRKLDTTTHSSTLAPTVAPNCASVTLVPTQTAPQQPNAGPGNVQAVAPVSTPVDFTKLTVSGTALMDGANVVKTFATAADAATAMGVMVTLGVTEIQRIGQVEVLLANGTIASGPLTGIAGRAIDPARYQVTVGVPNNADWVISQQDGTQFIEIVNFGALRDDAFSAVALLRTHKATRQSWLGPAAAPQMVFFTA